MTDKQLMSMTVVDIFQLARLIGADAKITITTPEPREEETATQAGEVKQDGC